MKKMMNTRTFLFIVAIIGIAAIVGCSASGSGGAATNPPPAGLAAVPLLTAGNYAVLAETAVTSQLVPASAITGDIAVNASSPNLINFGIVIGVPADHWTSAQVTGKLFSSDLSPAATVIVNQASIDMVAAYTDAAGRLLPDQTDVNSGVMGDLGGLTFTKGLYKFTTAVAIPPAGITISGSASDIWIFQVDGALSAAALSNVTLTGGALAQNIFWQVHGAATIGATSVFYGTLLASGAVTVNDGATVHGKILGQTGVTLTHAIVEP
jgi:hypothetical protein